jgi:hypothetical protein
VTVTELREPGQLTSKEPLGVTLSLMASGFLFGNGAAVFYLSLGRLALEWIVSVQVSLDINGDYRS